MTLPIRATLLATILAHLPLVVSAQTVADTIFENGDFYTVDAAKPTATSMAVKDGEIVAIGGADAVENYRGESTSSVDLDGKLVLPGFVSSHLHPGVAGLLSSGMQLVGLNSEQEILDAVRAFADENPDKKALFGFGWAPGLFGVDGPTAALLDQAVSDRAVYLIALDAHSAWVNTAGLELLNITKDTPDPVPGVHYYMRDANGDATGWLVEASAFWPALTPLGLGSQEDFRTAHEGFLPALPSVGITTVFDAGVPGVETNSFAALVELDSEGKLPVRYFASHYVLNHHDAGQAREAFLAARSQYKSPRFSLNAVKISNDGTIEGTTAALQSPYATGDGHSHYGATLFSEQQLYDLVKPLDAAGIPVMVHAIGDKTTAEAINVLERLRAENPYGTARHSLTHLQFMQDADMKRLHDARIVAQVSPPWAQDVNQSVATWQKLLGDSRVTNMMKFRSMLDAGVLLSMGSDFPASGVGFLESSPLFGIEVGMTRKTPGNPDMAPLPPADEVLSLEQLIYGYTMGSAYQIGQEQMIGSLSVGKKADFIVLSQDLFDIAPEQVHETLVEQTYVDGVAIHTVE